MLVLSRRPGQKIVFPSLGIAIEVLRSNGSVTRLGIEAPDDVPVLRDEILAKMLASADDIASSTLSPNDRQRCHEWRNKLNQLMLKLQRLQRQLELGQAVDPERNLADVYSDLSLKGQLARLVFSQEGLPPCSCSLAVLAKRLCSPVSASRSRFCARTGP